VTNDKKKEGGKSYFASCDNDLTDYSNGEIMMIQKKNLCDVIIVFAKHLSIYDAVSNICGELI